jgi:hypothetical protein
MQITIQVGSAMTIVWLMEIVCSNLAMVFWKEFGTVDFVTSDNELLIKIPNSTIGLPAKGFNIEFKWSDNMMKDDPLDWYINGDTAPGGRLNLTIGVE